MKPLRRFELIAPAEVRLDPPEPQGWQRAFHGYYYLDGVSSERKREAGRIQHASEQGMPAVPEGGLEVQAFANIMGNLDVDRVTLLELGAGRGDWCLAVAAAVEHGFVPTPAKSYRCLAVEAEPTHFVWTRHHFRTHRVNCEAVWAAVQARDGRCRFDARIHPADSYGQAVDPRGNVDVEAVTVDTLMDRFAFDRFDIVHMDVQGAEADALRGADRALREGRIDHFIIGTHSPALHAEVRSLLSPTFDILIDVPGSGHGIVDTPLGPQYYASDGVIVAQRRP